jgi:hypothetical protein
MSGLLSARLALAARAVSGIENETGVDAKFWDIDAAHLSRR